MTGAVIAIVLSLPWFLWMYHVLGWPFVHQYALAGNLYYLTQPVSFSSRQPNHTLYVLTFIAGFFPWSVVVIGGAVDTIRRWRARVQMPPEELLLWAWVGVVFIFFSIARFKVDRYVYPAAPACCLLAARAWMSLSIMRPDLALARDNTFARWSVGVLGVVLVLVGAIAAYSVFDLGLELPIATLLIPISLAAGGAALTVTIFRRSAVSPALFGSLVATLLVIYACVAAFGLPVLESTRPTAVVAGGLRPKLAANERVGLYRLEKWRFSLRYYLERPVSRLQSSGDVRILRTRGGYVLMLDKDFARLRNDGVKLRSVAERPAVIGTTGKGLRRQKWGALVVATSDDTPRTVEKPQ